MADLWAELGCSGFGSSSFPKRKKKQYIGAMQARSRLCYGLKSSWPRYEAPVEQRWSPYADNGGTCMGVAGMELLHTLSLAWRVRRRLRGGGSRYALEPGVQHPHTKLQQGVPS